MELDLDSSESKRPEEAFTHLSNEWKVVINRFHKRGESFEIIQNLLVFRTMDERIVFH